MSSPLKVVITADEPRRELPAWVTKFAIVVHSLKAWGVLKAIETIYVARKDGYSLIDAMGVLLAYFCSNERPRNGLRGFCRAMSKGLGKQLAALLGRESMPSSAALSRLLGSIGKAEVELVIAAIGSACRKLPVHPLGMFHDSHGKAWTVFDLDAVVTAFRLRALPTHEDLPKARRRTEEAAAPGYPGRKRGETQISSSRLEQAGSALWVGQATVPGNASMSEAVAEACAWLAGWCGQHHIEPAQVLIRIDGAGGNEPCAEAVHKAGFKLLARSAHYTQLGKQDVEEYLRGDVFFEVPSSLSGPVKHAADLGQRPLTASESCSMRTIVTRFTSGTPGKKSGAGHLIGAAQYEMFITDLDAGAWPCEDVVSLYFGRAAGENSFARANDEFGLERTFSLHGPGQDFAVLVGMLLSNVMAELGGLMVSTGNESPVQLPRGERSSRRFDDVPPRASVATVEECPQAARSAPAVTDGDAELLRLAFAHRPDFQVRGSEVYCPNDVLMRLHRKKPLPQGQTWLSFRAPLHVCAPCPKRSQCTSVSTPSFVKEISVTLQGETALRPLPTVRAPAPVKPTKSLQLPAAVVGLLACLHPLLVVTELRAAFQRASELVRVAIHIKRPRARLQVAKPHVAKDAAQRQHRRKTFAQKLDWNAAPTGSTLTVEFIGGAAINKLLPVAAPIALAS
jgi:hypothetical protein